MDNEKACADALDRVVRGSYGKLLAYIAKRNRRDIQAAEDALADAFASALESWEQTGIPQNPEAWLLRVARNRLIDHARKQQRVQYDTAIPSSVSIAPTDRATENETIPDERLQMMFACAHPAIDPSVRTALLLQAVLGIPAERIASVFLVSPRAMSQRLVRAKIKIRDAGISFRLPEELDMRSQVVLDAIYAAFAIGWDGQDSIAAELVDDAIALVRIVVDCLPDNSEACGLLALLLYCDARRGARRDSTGQFIPLDEQQVTHWESTKIQQAEEALRRASRLGRSGRYQLEAAIQSAHMERRFGGDTPWQSITELYGALLHFAPTIGVLVARAAAIARNGSPSEALDALEAIDRDAIASYQPFWAVRADVLSRLDHPEKSLTYDRAIGLTADPAIRAFLRLKQSAMRTKQ